MKTLVIHGESDLIPISASQKIADSIPNSKLLMIKECGHFPYVERPQAYFKEINQFLTD